MDPIFQDFLDFLKWPPFFPRSRIVRQSNVERPAGAQCPNAGAQRHVQEGYRGGAPMLNLVENRAVVRPPRPRPVVRRAGSRMPSWPQGGFLLYLPFDPLSTSPQACGSRVSARSRLSAVAPGFLAWAGGPN
jgi:hypothetical protein